MPLLLAAVLALVQTPEHDPGPPAKLLDEAVRAMPGYAAAKALPPVGDEAFLRRVTKDLVDAAPSDAEIKAFVDDPDPGKRARGIDRLLQDDRWSAYWAKRFTRVFIPDLENYPWTESGLPPARQGEAVEDFARWLSSQLRRDKPWTEIVHQMIDARGLLEGDPTLAWLASMRRGKGYALEFAERFSRDLLGVRIGCARCHDHPYEDWRTEDYYGMAAFIVRQRVRVAGGAYESKYSDEGEMKMDSGGPKTSFGRSEGSVAPPKFLYGGTAGKNDDRMKVLAALVTQKTTSQLPRALANRVWSWLLGAGVVNPVDDFTKKKSPLSPTLLEAMVKLLQENNHSVRHLVRVACLTQAYQMPTPEEAPEGESFRHLAARKAAPQPPEPSSGPLPLKVELPEGWVRVRERGAVKGRFLLPHPTEKGRWAELGLYTNPLPKEQWASQVGWGWMDPMKTEVTPLEGKGGLKVTLTEVAGPNWCVRGADGPVEFRFWLAEVAASPKPLHFRVAAPAELLDARRDAFVAFLKSLSVR